MSRRLSGINPLSYLGVEPYTPPAMLKNGRTPTNNDFANPGDFWLVIPPGYSGPESLHVLVSLNAGIATWAQLWPASSGGASEFETDSGSVVPALGIVNILGDGVKINTTGSGNTIVIHSDSDVANEYVTDSGTAIPSSNQLNVVGGFNINTTGASNTVTVNLNDFVTIVTLDTFADVTVGGSLIVSNLTEGVVQSDNSGVLFSDKGTNGQLLIGSTAGAPAWANITSTGATVTITNNANSINLETAGGGGGGTSCSFFAYQNSNQNIILGVGAYEGLGSEQALIKKFDVSNDLTTGDGSGTPAIFTAPVTGKYYLNMAVTYFYGMVPGATIPTIIRFNTTGGQYQNRPIVLNGGQVQQTNEFSACIDMTAGDTATFEVLTPALPVTGFTIVGSASPYQTWISGFLVGAGGGGNTIVSQFTSSGTWTKNGSTQYVEIHGWNAGGGGASGGLGGANAVGGGSGGSYGYFNFEGPGFCFPSSAPIIIGTGGAGGASRSSPGIAIPGVSGGVTSFNGLSTAAAAQSIVIAGPQSGGGAQFGSQPYQSGYLGSYDSEGFCLDDGLAAMGNSNLQKRVNPVAQAFYGNGGYASTISTQWVGSDGRNGGSGNGFLSFISGSSVNGSYPVTLFRMPTNGGGGAGQNSASPAAYSGGAGGSMLIPGSSTPLIAGGTAGLVVGPQNGGNGGAGLAAVGVMCGGTGGGGGSSQFGGTAAGNGGNGGFPGGGGGGGGAGISMPSGSGGDGADGLIIVIEYL